MILRFALSYRVPVLSIGKLFLSFVAIFLTVSAFSQTDNATVISGQVNSYYKVIQMIQPGSVDSIVSVRLGSVPTDLHSGDAVLITQMKGPQTTDPDPSGLGITSQRVGFANRYEILKVAKVSGDTVTFSTKLTSADGFTYDPAKYVQLIRVPIYRSVTVKGGALTCKPWNKADGTGGILALMAVDTITLQDNINVNYKGFQGANPGSEVYTGSCSITDTVLYDSLNYSIISSNRAGLKGEGVYIDSSHLARGRGFLLSNPGGGNGKSGGGGGGSNFASGGQGGTEGSGCTPNSHAQAQGGNNYSSFGSYDPAGGYIPMASGGGSGSQPAGLFASPGGNGGGIVIMLSQVLVSNNDSIKAGGAKPIASTAGGGGGGGGGTVYLDADQCLGSLYVNINGGDGGDTEDGGPGGGGGGGIFWFGRSSVPGTIICQPSRSSPGLNTLQLPQDATDAPPGIQKVNLKLWLRGFLFNYIPKYDTVCKGSVPKTIVGSLPRGGDGAFVFAWEKSINKTTWTLVGTSKDYQPPVLDTLTYFRRKVTSAGITDVSDTCIISVFPVITNNLIPLADTTLCAGVIPAAIKGSTPGGGTGIFRYQWQQCYYKNASYSNIIISGASRDYAPPALSDTTLFRRIVISGGCQDTTLAKRMDILPAIKGNTILPQQTICYAVVPKILYSDSLITGGDTNPANTVIQWQQWTQGVPSWNPASGTNNTLAYSPPALTDTIYYRRVIQSGPGSPMQCISISNSDTIIVLNSIGNNLITSGQTICAQQTADTLRGTVITGGDPIKIRYRWEMKTSASAWDSIHSYPAAYRNFAGGAMYDTTWYRRWVFSGIGDACQDISNQLVVNVQPRISHAGVFGDTMICFGQNPLMLLAEYPQGGAGTGTYAFTWQVSANNVTWSNAPGTFNQPQYDPDTLRSSRYFRRRIQSGVCDSISRSVVISVLPSISGNFITARDSVCNNDSALIQGTGAISGGDGTYKYDWMLSHDGTAYSLLGEHQSSYTADTLHAEAWYRRIVKSGDNDCCRDTSNAWEINVFQLPVAVLAGSDRSICSDSYDTLDISFTGKSPWYFSIDNGLRTISDSSATTHKRFVFLPDTTAASYNVLNYSLAMVRDGNNCKATDMSGSSQTTVYRYPRPFSAGEVPALICGNTQSLGAIAPPSWVSYAYWSTAGDTSMMFSGSDSALYNPSVTNRSLSAMHTADTAKLYWIAANGQCRLTDSLILVFQHKPVASMYVYNRENRLYSSADDYPKDTSIYNSETANIYTYPVVPPDSGWWTTDNPAIQISSPGHYITQVTNLAGGRNTFVWTLWNEACGADTAVFRINVNGLHPWKGFSPGSGINDYFWVEGIEQEPGNISVVIMAGSGKLVYKYEGPGAEWGGGKGWDGRGNRIDNNGQDLPEGTYYYIIKTTTTKPLTGYILLRRMIK